TGWTATITPRGLDFSFSGSSTLTYGDALSTLGTLTGVLAQDAGRVTAGSFTATDQNGAPVDMSVRLGAGQDTLALNGLTGDRAFNYVLNPGSGTQSVGINQRPVTFNIGAVSAVYGDQPVVSPSLANTIAGDDVSLVLNLNLATRRDVGTYQLGGND